MQTLPDNPATVHPIATMAALLAAVAADLSVRGLRPTIDPAGVEVTIGGRRVRLAAVPPVSGGCGEPWDDFPRRTTFEERRALWDDVSGEVVAYHAEA